MGTRQPDDFSDAPQSEGSSDPNWSGTPIDKSDPEIVAKYEPYLRMLSRSKMRRAYQAKLGASDLVQQAMVQAIQAFDQFRGETDSCSSSSINLLNLCRGIYFSFPLSL